MRLSAAQLQILKHAVSDDTSILAGGAVRSGKSYAVMLSFALWLISQEKKYHHAMVGQSIESVLRNVGFDFIDFVNSCDGCHAILNRKVGTRIVVTGRTEQSVWLIGANDITARKRIQGSTLKGLVFEELTLLPRDFFFMAWSRLSVAGAKMWGSYNPEGPSHWCKREVIDTVETFEGKIQQFRMRDNPSLDEKTIARYEKSFTGHFHKRLIQGLWSAASGNCFPSWEITNVPHVVKGNWVMAMDWAVSGTLACLAISVKGRKAIVSQELYHNGKTAGILTEVESADMIVEWWEKITEVRGAVIILDPSTPASFKRILRERGIRPRDADNSVIPGIMTTATRLAQKEIKINESCVELIREMRGYVYDNAAAERGKDKVLERADDHFCDALRYFAHTTGKLSRMAAPMTVKEALA